MRKLTPFKRTLNTSTLTILALACVSPISIMILYGEVIVQSQGHFTHSFLLSFVIFFFTLVSYTQLIKQWPLNGGVYSYTQRSYGGNVGFLAGWIAFITYLFLILINYWMFSTYLNTLFPDTHFGLFFLPLLFLVTIINILGVRYVHIGTAILISLQMIFFLFFCYFALAKQESRIDVGLEIFTQQIEDFNTLFLGAATLLLLFWGIESVTLLAEETKQPHRKVPKALWITLVILLVVGVSISYLAQMLFNEWGQYPKEMIRSHFIFLVAQLLGGKTLHTFYITCYLTGLVASILVLHLSLSRLLFTIGREGVVFNNLFVQWHRTFHSPYAAVLAVTLCSLLAFILSIELLFPMLQFGILTIFTLVNLCAIKLHFATNAPNSSKNLLFGLIFPVIGLASILWLWMGLDIRAWRVGAIIVLIGGIILFYLTRGFRETLPMLDQESLQKIIAASEQEEKPEL